MSFFDWTKLQNQWNKDIDKENEEPSEQDKAELVKVISTIILIVVIIIILIYLYVKIVKPKSGFITGSGLKWKKPKVKAKQSYEVEA